MFEEGNGIIIWNYGTIFHFKMIFCYNNQWFVLFWTLIFAEYSEVSLELFIGNYLCILRIFSNSLSFLNNPWPSYLVAGLLFCQTRYKYQMKNLKFMITPIYQKTKYPGNIDATNFKTITNKKGVKKETTR